jgi:hypothetical protein
VENVMVESVADWPVSMATGLTEIVEAVRAELTVTDTDPEVFVLPAPSVTWSSNFHVLTVVRVGEVEAGEVQDEEPSRLLKLLAPGASWSHWQVNGAVPPLNVADRVVDWPESIVIGVAVGALTVSAALTAIVAPPAVDELSGVAALSLTLAQYVVVEVGGTVKVVEVPETSVCGEPEFVGLVQLDDALVSSWMSYGEVPAPVQVTVRVIDCPLSMVADGEIVTVVPVKAELTVTKSVTEVAPAAGLPCEESVTS